MRHPKGRGIHRDEGSVALRDPWGQGIHRAEGSMGPRDPWGRGVRPHLTPGSRAGRGTAGLSPGLHGCRCSNLGHADFTHIKLLLLLQPELHPATELMC